MTHHTHQHSHAVTQIPEPPLAKLLFADTRLAWLWLLIRLYVGWQWLEAGWSKVQSPLWTGAQAGSALSGFFNAAMQKASGLHPDVQSWYATFLQEFALRHTVFFAHLVAYGELLVGLGLIFGLFTGIAAFFGSFMNANYLLAGTVSINPVLLILQLFLILAWRVAGFYGIDRALLPYLGTPWHKGQAFD